MAKEETDRTGMVERNLSDDEVRAKGEELAALCQKHEKLAEKKRNHNRKWNEELITLDAAIKELSEEIERKTAWVSAQDQFDFAKDASGASGKKSTRRQKGANGVSATAE